MRVSELFEAVKGSWKVANLSGAIKTFKANDQGHLDSEEAKAWMRNRGDASQVWDGRHWVENAKKAERELKKHEREMQKLDREEARANKPRKLTPEELIKIHHKGLGFIGNSFPDGDPIDSFHPWLKKNGYTMDDANAAFKKYEKTDFYGYQARMWEEHAKDAIHDAKNGHVHAHHWAYHTDDNGKIIPNPNPWK